MFNSSMNYTISIFIYYSKPKTKLKPKRYLPFTERLQPTSVDHKSTPSQPITRSYETKEEYA